MAFTIGSGAGGLGDMQEKAKLVAGLFSVAACVPR
jgi:hypothetical protein